MITQPYRIYIERTDRQKDMSRFYALAIERTLFGEICLRRRWGRIGTQGQELIHYFESEREAVSLFLDIACRKRRRGYSPRKRGSAARQSCLPDIELPRPVTFALQPMLRR
ncbi:WGR domain-containing protein [Neorhizobium sp. NCHU2750]|uniref:WGR domain-containing protein n=1 Tax=Neorhizobium sp. NCHU2750 TaxID=1825976 RepID=UPI000E7720C2